MSPITQHNLDTQVALLNQRLDQIGEKIGDLETSLSNVQKDIENINNMANRYRGGLLVVLALGGLIGWAVTISDKVLHWFGHA